MRAGILDLNDRYRDLLSNDLGAVGGLLFDIGSGRFPAPPRSDSTENARDWTAMLDETRAQAQKLDKAIANQKESDRTHGEIQRSEEHTSELQSLMRITYAVFCLKKKIYNTTI